MPYRNRTKGWLALSGIVLAVTFVWGVVLPKLADTEMVRAREAFLREHRINPAAMFYTELECLESESENRPAS
ncbi:hypothetical protein [Blastopirellula marina]|uniref:Uncharacterized protein n=1 Tax=Blastopirellula marina TaxID=124 RepID=A0A2S8F814_9BACT|nr:hypothetical protein [Blastopirellula marina]PQO28297.1 hypothetical protein C5Y98_25725 [Blastopirellula marina]PTL41837.1 hypothetical protein C5Y97_25740 [Blastopirellula marina]